MKPAGFLLWVFYAERLHRNHDNKEDARIYDYIDINVLMLEKMYQKRLRGHGGVGYQTKTITKFLSLTDFSKRNITVITRPIEDYKNNTNKWRTEECFMLLEQAECEIRLRSMIHQKFAITDKKHGSINLLNLTSLEESIMRIESADIAEELTDSVIIYRG